jgi:hypothetical protein
MRLSRPELGCRAAERKNKERLFLGAESQYSAFAMGSTIEESETITDKGVNFPYSERTVGP